MCPRRLRPLLGLQAGCGKELARCLLPRYRPQRRRRTRLWTPGYAWLTLDWISWRALDWLKKEECPTSIVDECNMASAYNGSSYNGGDKNGLSRISTLHFEFSFFQTCVTQFKPPSMLSSASESQCPAMRIHDQMTSTLL